MSFVMHPMFVAMLGNARMPPAEREWATPSVYFYTLTRTAALPVARGLEPMNHSAMGRLCVP